MPENIIEVENLEKSYGQVRAVQGISFAVGRGSLFSFLGVNGAGKSTAINILCTLLKKDAGRVRIAGFDLDAEPEKNTPPARGRVSAQRTRRSAHRARKSRRARRLLRRTGRGVEKAALRAHGAFGAERYFRPTVRETIGGSAAARTLRADWSTSRRS